MATITKHRNRLVPLLFYDNYNNYDKVVYQVKEFDRKTSFPADVTKRLVHNPLTLAHAYERILNFRTSSQTAFLYAKNNTLIKQRTGRQRGLDDSIQIIQSYFPSLDSKTVKDHLILLLEVLKSGINYCYTVKHLVFYPSYNSHGANIKKIQQALGELGNMKPEKTYTATFKQPK